MVEFAAWGLFGGFAVEGLEFAGAIRRAGGWPWKQPGEPSPLAFAISVIIRLVISAGVAAAAGAVGQVSGPLGALAAGVAAPLLVEQLARQLPDAIRPVPSSASNHHNALPATSQHMLNASESATDTAPSGAMMRANTFLGQLVIALARDTPAFRPRHRHAANLIGRVCTRISQPSPHVAHTQAASQLKIVSCSNPLDSSASSLLELMDQLFRAEGLQQANVDDEETRIHRVTGQVSDGVVG